MRDTRDRDRWVWGVWWGLQREGGRGADKQRERQTDRQANRQTKRNSVDRIKCT